ncbi:hypothetical protein PsYK624_169780 [Phanerochaete sordida]|uniref:Uncharacterized protein n=1 Tax=Phanerochaete sordida TaxID=48140 RepID=A0A9P3GYF6_9APHY|nr:hypothetical protein PsYK624_169780 [Phanerochaete sordida]
MQFVAQVDYACLDPSQHGAEVFFDSLKQPLLYPADGPFQLGTRTWVPPAPTLEKRKVECDSLRAVAAYRTPTYNARESAPYRNKYNEARPRRVVEQPESVTVLDSLMTFGAGDDFNSTNVNELGSPLPVTRYEFSSSLFFFLVCVAVVWLLFTVGRYPARRFSRK